MIVTWKCTNDACQESNHLKTRDKLSIATGESEEFHDEVACWQCGKIHGIRLEVKAEMEEV